MAKEGVPFLLAAVVPFLGTAIVGYIGNSVVWTVVALLFGLAAAFIGFFFRDPDRVSPASAAGVLAPADGKIVSIESVSEAFMGGECLRISTFLSIFNVHVQRAPTSGRVEEYTYHPGTYLAAWEPKASEENERASLGLISEDERLMVRQIAGLIARRIVTDHRVGDEVRRGDRIGLIRFGSRVDLFVPLDWNVLCKVGDRVQAGATLLLSRSEPSR